MKSYKKASIALSLLLLLLVAMVGCATKNNVTPRDGAVSGTVVDKGNNAIYGARVSWTQDGKFTSQTDSSGKFYIDGINFGDQTFSVAKDGYISKTFTAKIYSNYIVPVGNIVIATASFTITDIVVKSTSATTAEISWKTSEFTNGYIEYGESTTFGNSEKEKFGDYSTLHNLTISNLKPETQFYFRVVATRQGYSTEKSESHDFATLSALEDKVPPSPPKAVEAAMTGKPNQVTLTWAPNSETDLKGYKLYRSELPLAGFQEITGGIVNKGRERYVDAGLVAGKKYYYRVAAIDQAGNEGSTTDIVSITVPGDIVQRIQWSRVHSPYYVTGDLDIQSTGVLEIEPGVEVRMADYDILLRGDPLKIEIRIAGSITASGSENFPITFSSGKPAPSSTDWGGISFNKAPNGLSSLENVVIAHAKTGVTFYQTSGTYQDLRIQDCTNGIVASLTTDLTVASCTITNCEYGILLNQNVRLTVADTSVKYCVNGLYSAKNDTVTYSGNNFLDFEDSGLTTDESQGTLMVENNLFVSPTGVGLHVIDRTVQVQYNTFDAGTAIRVDKGSPTIQKNILVLGKSVLANNSKGIEYLAEGTTKPEYGPNNVYGFPEGQAYVGCASTPNSLALEPKFHKDFGSSEFDYRLKVGLPSNEDYWGIVRSDPPN